MCILFIIGLSVVDSNLLDEDDAEDQEKRRRAEEEAQWKAEQAEYYCSH